MPGQRFECSCGYATTRHYNLNRHRARVGCEGVVSIKAESPQNSLQKRRMALLGKHLQQPAAAATSPDRLLMPPPPPVVSREGSQMSVIIGPSAKQKMAIESLIDQTGHQARMLSPPGTPIPTRTWPPMSVDPPLARPIAPAPPPDRALQRIQELEAWQARVRRNIRFLFDDIND